MSVDEVHEGHVEHHVMNTCTCERECRMHFSQSVNWIDHARVKAKRLSIHVVVRSAEDCGEILPMMQETLENKRTKHVKADAVMHRTHILRPRQLGRKQVSVRSRLHRHLAPCSQPTCSVWDVSVLIRVSCVQHTAMTVPYFLSLKVCGGPDVSLLVGAITIILIVLWCVCWVAAHENTAKRKDVFTLFAIIGSQFVTIFQMFGALSALPVAWPAEPFATLVEFGSLMNFRLEILNIGCVVSTSPLHRYIGNAFSFAGLIACMIVHHFLHMLALRCQSLRRFHTGQKTSSLFGAVGHCVHDRLHVGVFSDFPAFPK